MRNEKEGNHSHCNYTCYGRVDQLFDLNFVQLPKDKHFIKGEEGQGSILLVVWSIDRLRCGKISLVVQHFNLRVDIRKVQIPENHERSRGRNVSTLVVTNNILTVNLVDFGDAQGQINLLVECEILQIDSEFGGRLAVR